MKPTSNSYEVVKVEFVCMGCKEGKHNCPGYWTGLGLEILCICRCTIKRNKPAYASSSHDVNNVKKKKDAGRSAWLPGTTRRAEIVEDNSTTKEVLSSG